ncbi:C6 finger domain-containing protein [Rutstroemia sp. NJR-2017a WRK4]|nr:C6 finger domain-containing protein [Rutstroemia sp. NJR-2017a WRK4]
MDPNMNSQNPNNDNANSNNLDVGYPTPTPSSTSSSHSYRRTPSQSNLNANANPAGSGSSDPTAQDQQQQKKVKAPRLYHKKSRNGCQRCKARRVKPPPPPNPEEALRITTTNGSSPGERISVHALIEDLSTSSFHQPRTGQDEIPQSINPTYYEDIPESKNRRMLELRLLQNYIISTSPTFPGCHTEETRHLWSVEVPKLAFNAPNLLYAMFSISALQHIVADPSNSEMQSARQHYLGLALREHQKAVATLNKDSADAVCFASILILNDAFSSLQIRSIKPYTIPMHWLQMARGAASVFHVALNLIKNNPDAKAMALLRTKPALTKPEELNRPSNYANFAAILSHPPPSSSAASTTSSIPSSHPSPSTSMASPSASSPASPAYSPQSQHHMQGNIHTLPIHSTALPHPSIPPSHLIAYQSALTYLGSIHHVMTSSPTTTSYYPSYAPCPPSSAYSSPTSTHHFPHYPASPVTIPSPTTSTSSQSHYHSQSHRPSYPYPYPPIPPEHPLATARRFTAFGLQVPKAFIDLVEAKEPRALIIFAHYFALAKCLTLREDPMFWWVGDTVDREVRGLLGMLGRGWDDILGWVKTVVGM